MKEPFNTIKNLLLHRHSWREYKDKKIPQTEIDEILEVARHTPTAFGIEPYHLIVIGDEDLKNKLYPYIWKQKQVLKSSHLILFLTYKKNVFVKDSDFLKHRYKTRYNNDVEVFNNLQNNFLKYLKENIKDYEEWAKRQSYILLANVILTAYAKDIGTSPMEGFDNEKIINFLEENNYIFEKTFNVSVVLALGYIPENKKLNFTSKFLTLKELVTTIK